MLDEEEHIAKTKECMRHILLAVRLKVEPPEDAKTYLRSMWILSDDAQLHEYRMLWLTVDAELMEANNVR